MRPRWWVMVGLSAVLVVSALLRGWLRGWSFDIAVPMSMLVVILYAAFRESRAMESRAVDKESSDAR